MWLFLIPLPAKTREESSADSNKSQESGCGISFTYSKNTNGPGMEPCVTPDDMSPGLEYSSPKFTLNILFAMYDSNHFMWAEW